ncbi:hypothetical protein IL306_009806 [Fusarium sp. DS 682]|nr:hypothetical protein IL306_009806 [Fusarium sp. DS 682]
MEYLRSRRAALESELAEVNAAILALTPIRTAGENREGVSDLPELLPETLQSEVVVVAESASQSPPSKLSLLTNPGDAPEEDEYMDSRFKEDTWRMEKTNESFARDFLMSAYCWRSRNEVPGGCPIIFLTHIHAAECPMHQVCTHWELRWEDIPRREPGSIELEVICFDPKTRDQYKDPSPESGKLYFYASEDPKPINCRSTYLFNALRPDFSSVKALGLEVVLFRMVEHTGEWTYDEMGVRYMDQYGRLLETLM